MKKLLKSSLSLAMAALMSLSMFAHAGEAVADDHASSVSYNVGYMSDYWYRGVFIHESAVSFGADYESGGIYAGTWWADVGDGLEYDVYAGYSMDLSESMSAYVGYTGYFYTDGMDSDYNEINIGLSMGLISIDYADGRYDTPVKEDYTHTQVAIDMSAMSLPLTLTFGVWGGDETTLSGEWYSVSYGATVSGVDVGLEVGQNSDDICCNAPNTNTDTTFAVFSLGYSF